MVNRFLGWRLAALINGFQDATAYRIEFLFEVLGQAAVPVAIQWVLWFSLTSGGGNFGGMTYVELLQYTFTSMLFSQIRGGDHDFELAEMIRSGSLSNYLLKPVSVVEFVYLRGIAAKILIAGTCLLAGALASHWLGVSPFRLLGGMFLAMIGNIIHYQISAALASISFYWEEAYAVLWIKNMVVSILSGELIPLSLVPESWSWVWKSLPFYLYVYGPTEFALGKWSTQEYFHQLLISCAWLIVGWILIRTSWKIGIYRYQSLGG